MKFLNEQTKNTITYLKLRVIGCDHTLDFFEEKLGSNMNWVFLFQIIAIRYSLGLFDLAIFYFEEEYAYKYLSASMCMHLYVCH